MYTLLLCQRYLRTRFIALASVISVTLGVATMIVVNSVMTGFSTEMKDRIHGLLTDLVVETHSLDGVPDPDGHMARAMHAAGPYIEAMTATVEVHGLMHFNYAGQWITQPITLMGVDPVSMSKVGPLQEFLASYRPEMKDGQVIRPAERTADTPPGWELTESARDYRLRKIEAQRWHGEQLDLEAPTASLPGSNAWPDAVQQVAGQESELPAGAFPGELTDADFSPTTGLMVRPAALETPIEPAANPFMQAQPAPLAPADPAALAAGRLYVGVGAISFPYKDPETGKMEQVMMAQPGDDVKISTVTAGRPPEPAHFGATIVDVFKSGMADYDSSLVLCNLRELQKVRGMLVPATGEESITTIKIKLKDFSHADAVVERLQAVFPPSQFTVRTWEQKQGPLLAAVEVEAAILNVLLFLIVAVAGFGILAIFYMIVVEKTRDIGILKALGASSRGVMAIFLSYGLALGIVGAGGGVVLGLLFVRYINTIEKVITWLTGRKVFDETIYYFPEIPTRVSPLMVLWVALGAMLIAVLASVLPARRAAQLHPVKSLRHD